MASKTVCRRWTSAPTTTWANRSISASSKHAAACCCGVRAGQASEVVQIGGFQFDNAAHRVSLDGEPIELPNREYRLLEILVGRIGQVVGKDEIGNGLFGFDDEAGPNAIELYVGRLRKKLAGAPLRITTVRGVGYLLEASDGSADADD